jgi:hypothetical protein
MAAKSDCDKQKGCRRTRKINRVHLTSVSRAYRVFDSSGSYSASSSDEMEWGSSLLIERERLEYVTFKFCPYGICFLFGCCFV